MSTGTEREGYPGQQNQPRPGEVKPGEHKQGEQRPGTPTPAEKKNA